MGALKMQDQKMQDWKVTRLKNGLMQTYVYF